METAQDICGMTKGLCRNEETWWWNEDLAVAVKEKKQKECANDLNDCECQNEIF